MGGLKFDGEQARISREEEIRGFLANENRAIIMQTFIPNTEGLPEH
jgi:hypothetical protein